MKKTAQLFCKSNFLFGFANLKSSAAKTKAELTFSIQAHSKFLLSRPHSALSTGHLTLIYPTAAGKLTTNFLSALLRRQFLPIFQKRLELEPFMNHYEIVRRNYSSLFPRYEKLSNICLVIITTNPHTFL